MESELKAQAAKVAALGLEFDKRQAAHEAAEKAYLEINDAHAAAEREYFRMCREVIAAATAEIQFEQSL